jgi:uncharacterized hydrophobic protein (TIGR00271 family)
MQKESGDRGSFTAVRLSRGLSLWQAAAYGLGITVSMAVFVLLDDGIRSAGSLTPLAFLLAAFLVAANNLGYAELATSTPRPGGAYALVHNRSTSILLPFLTGWALALAGLSVCGLLAQEAAAHLGPLLLTYLNFSIPPRVLTLGILLLVILANSWGGLTTRRLSFTLPLILLLVGLALVALPQFEWDEAVIPGQDMSVTIALLVSVFVGGELIAAHRREIRRQETRFPLVFVGAPLVAAGLGGLVAVVVIGVVGIQPLFETTVPLALLGQSIADVVGHRLLLAIGAAATLLTLSRALSMVLRPLYGMAQDGFWPSWVRRIHPRQAIPTRLSLIAGLLVIPAIFFPPALLAQIGGLLYLFVLMAVNLTLLLRTGDEEEIEGSTFRLPFHPWVPALTLAVDVLVLAMWDVQAIGWAAGALLLGLLVYLVYGRGHHIEAQEGVTVFRPPIRERAAAFRILVPLTNPATAGNLLRLAACLVEPQGGEILALQVVVVREPLPLEAGRWRARTERVLMEEALALADGEGLPVQTMTRAARSVSQGILETADEERVDLILIGWRGSTRSRGTSLGSIVDAVLRDAPTHVMVVRGDAPVETQRILIPTAGGPHAQAALRLADQMAEACRGRITLLYVQPELAPAEQMDEARRRLTETLEGVELEHTPQQKFIRAGSVVEGIVEEAHKHDLVLLGISEESVLDQLVFGSIPLQVAARVPKTVLVQGERGLPGLWLRKLLRSLRGILPALNDVEQLEVQRDLARGMRPGVDYFALIVLSCIIAALGLLLDSPAVVIGAMLVAPLMSPIMALSLGLVLGDLRMIRYSAEALVKGAALTIVLATFIGLLSPLKTVTGEIFARTRPTLLDLMVALASGAAGAYALARKEVSAALPGVAIAAALMPPLATVGLGLALGDPRVAGGALLLFATNVAAISLAGAVIFILLGLRPQVLEPEHRRQLRQRLFASLLLLLAIAIPLGIILSRIVQDAAREQTAREVILQRLPVSEEQLVDLEVERRSDYLLIVVTVRSTEVLDQEVVNTLANALREELEVDTQVELIVLPVIRSGEG